MNIRQLLHFSPEEEWLLNILDVYHLEIFCVTEISQYPRLFMSPCFGRDIIDFPILDIPETFLERAVSDTEISGGLARIFIRCKVTKTILGYLSGKGDEEGIDKGAEVINLSSLSGLFSELDVFGQLGTKIGSLLLTLYTFLLHKKTKISKIYLISSPQGVPFYKKIEMEFNGKFYYKSFSSTFPEKAYYASLPLSLDVRSIIPLQRIYHRQKIVHLCLRLRHLMKQFEEIKNIEINVARKKALDYMVDFLRSPQALQNVKNIPDLTKPEIVSEIKKYCSLPYMNACKDIGVVRRIIEAFGAG